MNTEEIEQMLIAYLESLAEKNENDFGYLPPFVVGHTSICFRFLSYPELRQHMIYEGTIHSKKEADAAKNQNILCNEPAVNVFTVVYKGLSD